MRKFTKTSNRIAKKIPRKKSVNLFDLRYNTLNFENERNK